MKPGPDFGPFLGWQGGIRLSARVNRTSSRGEFELPRGAGGRVGVGLAKFLEN